MNGSQSTLAEFSRDTPEAIIQRIQHRARAALPDSKAVEVSA